MAEFVEVGKLTKTFGVGGEIKVKTTGIYDDDLNTSEVWFLHLGNDRVPYFIEKVSNEPHFLVKFEDVNSPEEGKKLSGAVVYLRSKDVSVVDKDLSPDFMKLAGFAIMDRDEQIGIIERVEEYPHQIMAIVRNGNEEIMIPLIDEWITEIEAGNSLIYMELPEGIVKSQL